MFIPNARYTDRLALICVLDRFGLRFPRNLLSEGERGEEEVIVKVQDRHSLASGEEQREDNCSQMWIASIQ